MSRPVPIRVIAVVPDGPPAWLWYNGRQYVVARAAGPERLETAWWRGPEVRRDYFRVTTASGEQFWIFHAAREGQWYLHGVFV
jgi:protein ImuB